MALPVKTIAYATPLSWQGMSLEGLAKLKIILGRYLEPQISYPCC